MQSFVQPNSIRFKNTNDNQLSIDKASISQKHLNKQINRKKAAFTRKPYTNFQFRKYKIMTKQKNIDLFFHKYAYNKLYLDYKDFQSSLLPNNNLKIISNHNEKIKMLKHIFQLKQKLGNNLFNLVALIIGTQINFIGGEYGSFIGLQNMNLQKSTLLWHLLDVNHCNYVDFNVIRTVAKRVQIQLTENQWKCFLIWHFQNEKSTMVRDDFMKILENLYDKRERSAKHHSYQLQLNGQRQNRLIQSKFESINIENIVRTKLADIQVKNIALSSYEKKRVKKQLDQFVNLKRIINRDRLISQINQRTSKKLRSNTFMSTKYLSSQSKSKLQKSRNLSVQSSVKHKNDKALNPEINQFQLKQKGNSYSNTDLRVTADVSKQFLNNQINGSSFLSKTNGSKSNKNLQLLNKTFSNHSRSKSIVNNRDKILLTSKIGYQNPSNLIRSSMIISLKL